MADEHAGLAGEDQPIPKGYRRADLAAPGMKGVALEQHYRDTLQKLRRRELRRRLDGKLR